MTASDTGPELRLALAMRGGVSLAVWIGGAVAEIDLVRRASPDVRDGAAPGQAFWKELLALSGYRAVTVDVLAGASAGGLNGVLYAASQVYDFDYDAMRAVWLDVGDTERLVRSRDSWFLPSMFRGDGFFAPQVEKALRERIPDRPDGERPPGPRVQLDLAATSLEPISRPVPSPSDEQLRDRRHASGFRFRNPEERWLTSSFHPRKAETRAAALWRLAVAARATSAFPAAFEAAEIVSTRRLTFGAPGPAATTDRLVEFDGNFLDRAGGEAPLPFAVSDGGILDNIPIARALEAATRAAASGPTERKLVYLQPGSRGSHAEPLPGAPRTSTAAVFKGALAARMSGENINADIEALEVHNEAVRRANALRLGGFDGITDRAALLVAARSRWGAYVSTRSGADAARTMALLRDPVGVLGADPFPRAIGVEPVDDDRWRSPLGTWGSSEREELGAGLHYLFHGALSAITPPASRDVLVATHDPEVLHRVALLLLEWAQYLEARDVPVGRTKQSLYGLRAFLEEALLGASRQLWVAAAAQLGAPTAAAYVARMIEVLPDLFRVDLAPAAMAKALLEDDAGVLRGEVREVYLRIDQVLTGTAPLGTTDLLAVLTDVLAGLGEALAGTPAPAPTTDPALQTGAALDAALRGIGPIDAHALAALEVVCLPEFVAGLPGRRRIEFHRCSSENRTPVARWFSAIREEIPVDDSETAPTGLRTHLVPVERKLAGNELGNFSAFLLPEWRANDWLWGRLDAAVTLGDLLVRPEPLARWLATQGTTVEEWHDALRARVRGADKPWDNAVVDAIWDEEDIRRELAALLAAGAEVADVEVPAIRDTFVARRQWDILCAERIGEPWSEPDAGAFAATNEWVGDYAVGDQTLASSNDPSGLRARLGDIVVAVTRTAVWNLKLGTAEDKAPRFVTGLLWGIGPRAGKIAGKRLTAPRPEAEEPPKKGRGRTALLALLVLLVWVGVPVALAALLGWGVAGPVLLGIVLLPLVVLAGFALWVRGVARRVDRYLRREEDRPSG